MGRPQAAALVSALREELDIAQAAVRAAAPELLERFRGPREGVDTKSTPTDLVSEADLAAERTIRAVLAERRPGDVVLGEEGGEQGEDGSGVRWVVDPLDGTVNYLFGIPQWCISVASEDGEGARAGVVYDPLRDECFAAVRGEGARLNGEVLHASRRADLATALVATGFGYDAEVRAAQARVVAGILPHVRDIRRAGSAALDLAWTAAARADAFYEFGVQAWDTAAGALLCAEAGLTVRTLPAAGALPAGLLAAPPALADPLERLLGEHIA